MGWLFSIKKIYDQNKQNKKYRFFFWNEINFISDDFLFPKTPSVPLSIS